MNYPEDSLQWFVGNWWEEIDDSIIKPGRLIFAYLPHVSQVPNQLVPEGRSNNPTDHTHAYFKLQQFHARNGPNNLKSGLPVAALPDYKNEIYLVERAKKRPAIILSTLDQSLYPTSGDGVPKWMRQSTMTVLPSYGADQDGSRHGMSNDFIERVRKCEYPQFLWDCLPCGGSTESVLRFDHIQPLGGHHNSYDMTKYALSSEALCVLQEWLIWYLTKSIPEDSALGIFREESLANA